MRRILKLIRKTDYKHYISAAITVFSAVLTFTVFPSAFTRIGESFRDLWLSFLYYFQKLLELDILVSPSVTSLSSVGWTPVFGLPETWEMFQASWSRFWQLYFDGENISSFFVSFGEGMKVFSRVLLLVVVPLVLVGVLAFRRYLEKHNNDYNKDSKALKAVKRLASLTYIPIKRWILGFISFNKEHPKHYKMWLFIWAFNFNLLTILVEFLAYYLYFVVSFDFPSIYRQVYKLFIDLTVPIAFIPIPLWVVIGYAVFCRIRANIGYTRLNHFEMRNRGFINERPIVFMICGTMGKRKTTAAGDMLLSQEVMFRDKALEKLLDQDMKLPAFPWINLENNLKWAMEKHKIYNLATCRDYIRRLRTLFYITPQSPRELRRIMKHLYKRYNLAYLNRFFDYDFERYGISYNDGLKLDNAWDILETYAQLYFIYTTQSALLFANFSIRTDTVVSDLGNFPLRDSDFFKRRSEDIDFISRYAKIADFDAFRLNRKVIRDNVNKDSFEFGAVGITEVGKERKNNLELQDRKRKDDVTNQKNDGFNDWLKMIRHSATVDNFPFVKVIADEQRPESWGADARDLCEIVHIRESSDTKLALPFFSIFELLYSFVFSKFAKLYTKYRYMRADNTLPLYAFKKLCSMLEHRYKRIYNTFGFCVLSVDVENGTQDGEVKKQQYYLCSKKIYSKRFSTDCFSDYFAKKAIRSTVGIDDMAEYGDVKATFDELKAQNSYFINDLIGKQENKE
ncbi:MAG: hypothetical protein IJE25_08965 [Clostridia bacterium]|nr:hypothetical protein [Clostridia bacterium]